MQIVSEWPTAARPEGRLGQMITVASLGALEIVSVCGAAVSISLQRGLTTTLAWFFIAIVLPIIGFALIANRYRQLQRWANDIPRVPGSIGPELFGDSSFGGPIASWRDWKHAHRAGEGAYFLGESGVQIFWRGNTPEQFICYRDIELVEVIRFKGGVFWSPQLRLRVLPQQQFVGAVARAGTWGCFGVTLKSLVAAAHEIDRRSEEDKRRPPQEHCSI